MITTNCPMCHNFVHKSNHPLIYCPYTCSMMEHWLLLFLFKM
ncbi:hypothetical protein [Traorella massiliensis]|nr:hypothetical protein [Traorella massiliensis]